MGKDKDKRKESSSMKEKKRDRNIVKEAVGDPAFYNDQIDENKNPMKGEMEKKEKKKGITPRG